MRGWNLRVMVLLVLCSACGSKDNNDNIGSPGAGGTLAPPPGGGTGVAGGVANTAGTGTAGTDSGAAGSVAGSGSGGTQAAGTGGSPAAGTGGDGGGGTGGSSGGVGIPENCRGFSFDGIMYSPGGSTLPNTCEPFDPTTNNPYAVRCVDVWPWFATEYPGDEFCILPPPPDLGVQFGVHPQGRAWFDQVSQGDMSGYDSPPAGFLLAPGGEEERNYHTAVSTTAEQKYYRNYTRMRGGSHHMINSTSSATQSQEMWGPGSPDGLSMGVSLPGAQRPDENAPKSLEKPADDAGLYAVLPAGTGVTFNMHHFNPTGVPILKETWINLWWETDATIPVKGLNGLDYLQVATMNIAPGSTTDLHYSAAITQPTRVLTLFGHRHAWTTAFTSWVQKSGGGTELIYQSFDWFDEPTYRYDSATNNPTAAVATKTDGGASGLYMLQNGDRLHYNCHITYTDARASEVSAPITPAEHGNLRFANQAFTAEMCILFGSTAQNSITGWGADSSPLPSFAQTP
jgi:hypothetical protein